MTKVNPKLSGSLNLIMLATEDNKQIQIIRRWDLVIDYLLRRKISLYLTVNSNMTFHKSAALII